MSRKCEHDCFDQYMMYNMMSNGGGKGSGEAFCSDCWRSVALCTG